MVVKRFIGLLLLAVLLAGCAAGPAKQEVKPKAPAFTNAVFVGSQQGLREAADPAVLRWNGEYWAYSTGSPCLVLKSADLVKWEYVGKMNEEPGSCWAPDVTYKNGTFYAYMATQSVLGVEGSRRVKLYTSDRPEGPFTFKSELTSAYSYDPDYFMDEDGQEYLYWTQECGTMAAVAPCSGNGNVGDRLIGMTKLAGRLTRIATPEGWECRGRCILEAPATLKRDGQYFQQYSGAAYENASYGGGYARAPYPLGTGGPKEAGWVKQNKLLQTVEGKVDGPGGGNWLKAPNGLDDWMIYHGRGISRQDWDRWFRIDPVMWGRDRFWLPGAPSSTPQPGPALPAFRDLFSRADGPGLGKEWTATGGTWSVAGGAARQSSGAGDARAVAGEAAGEYLVEASLRLLPGQGGSAGLVAFWGDEKNQLTALVDPKDGQLRLQSLVNGTPGVLGLQLPPGLDWKVWQQLAVRKNGDRFSFALNGQTLGDAVYAEFARPGRAGLATAGNGAEFDGFTFTHGWEDFFDAPAGWGKAEAGSAATGEWRDQESMLAQSAASGRAEAFKGSRTWGSYEFTASIRNDGTGAAGVYAAYYDPKSFVEVLLDVKSGALQSRSVLKGKAEMVATPLKDVDLKQWRTLRVVKDGFAFRFYLDGVLVQERQIPLAQGQPGLLTVDTPAAFDAIRAVRWD